MHACLSLFERETLKADSESILGSSSRMAWKVPLWLYWTTPTLVPGNTSNSVYTKLAAILLVFFLWLILKSFKKQGNMCMNKCMFTCIWLGVFGKGSQSVDGVDDKVLLQGEVSQTHWLWAVDHKHNVQGSAAFLTVCRQKHKLWESKQPIRARSDHEWTTEVAKLTTAAACFPDVVHDVTFLQEETKHIIISITSSVCFCWCAGDKRVFRWKVLTVRPGSPSGPGSPCRGREHIKSHPASQLLPSFAIR